MINILENMFLKIAFFSTQYYKMHIPRLLLNHFPQISNGNWCVFWAQDKFNFQPTWDQFLGHNFFRVHFEPCEK